MIKNIKYSVGLVLCVLVFTACSEYNKILNKGSLQERYALAKKTYEKESYLKAIRLYELILPSYQSKAESETIIYRLAEAHFKTKDFLTAIYYYEKLMKNFPNSTALALAHFKMAESYYNMSPKYSVDQTDTNKAIEAYQDFIDKNPNSDKIKDANTRIKALNYKLETKAFEIAKQYYKIGNYKSAITAFDNVMLDYLGTSYKEQALFFKFKSAYQLGVNSVYFKKKNRIDDAVKIYTRFKKAFPTSAYLKEANNLYDNLQKQKAPIQN